jgi:hypothetical protein
MSKIKQKALSKMIDSVKHQANKMKFWRRKK